MIEEIEERRNIQQLNDFKKEESPSRFDCIYEDSNSEKQIKSSQKLEKCDELNLEPKFELSNGPIVGPSDDHL